jgi:hypothetical protein
LKDLNENDILSEIKSNYQIYGLEFLEAIEINSVLDIENMDTNSRNPIVLLIEKICVDLKKNIERYS